MSKLKADISIIYSGIFSQWDSQSDDLPRFLEATVHVPAVIDTEFGFIARIKKAKNQVLTYCIYHPDIPDDNGHVRPPFDGEVFIKENDWRFYLGDCIWAPVSNKLGNWRMTLELNGKIVADKTFKIYLPE
ncbi:DUF3859 domain-containing protein [Shewanella inventionis]|uniref:DUF3859 domain-containing protein n=1 Tax=Shewanella inventionis TaxID=1738770 RepID=A0ABQ1IMS6_9GAMM|nr:DUF3859 domain-containing protein [Shewanella inventionis]MCL1156480.1 DUF3859 domain-containing protein [Shewanella inventionis]UAL44174.1 DUF3859 domain-containing protein [Shewanella inventionis]GGB45887.1 hypothetical protein GCM10011607_02430 [Shewanella inventionis]